MSDVDFQRVVDLTYETILPAMALLEVQDTPATRSAMLCGMVRDTLKKEYLSTDDLILVTALSAEITRLQISILEAAKQI